MTAKPPRQRKTPAQRASENLATAQRIRDRLHKQAQQRRKDLEDLDRELREAEARLAYAKQDPALPNRLTVTPGQTATSGDRSTTA